jgi:AraC-like DNA-binding protein
MKRKTGKPIFFLNLQVLFITLNNLQAWLIDMGLISSLLYIKYLRIPWYFLCMPMFYVFLIHYLKLEKKTRHFILATIGLFLTFILCRLLIIAFSQYQGYPEEELKRLMMRYGNIEEITGFIYTMVVFTKSISIFYRRKRKFEFVLLYDDLIWIRHFMNLAGLVILMWVIALTINLQNQQNNSPVVYYPLRLSTTILIYWIGFKGLFRFRIMEDRIVLRKNIKSDIKTDETGFHLNEKEDSNERVESIKQRELFQKINDYVENRKLYLDPYLGLDRLAKLLELSPGYLSYLINNYSSDNFSDYINKMRISQVKELITDTDYMNYTAISIGLESGFNSKSTFYKAFKKFTGMSPVEFKKLSLEGVIDK